MSQFIVKKDFTDNDQLMVAGNIMDCADIEMWKLRSWLVQGWIERYFEVSKEAF